MENALEPIAIVLGFLTPCKYKKASNKKSKQQTTKATYIGGFCYRLYWYKRVVLIGLIKNVYKN